MSDYLDLLYNQLSKPCDAEKLDEIQSAPSHRGNVDLVVNFGLWIEGEDLLHPVGARPLEEIAPHLMDTAPRDTGLWEALFRVHPAWKWGRQPTGDCTRWGKQHGLDCTMAVAALNGKIATPGSLVAGEVIYGFAKAELANNFGRKGAGSTSWAVSEAARKYGWLHRGIYRNGAEVIDLTNETSYSVTWGQSPGRGVPDWLELIAAKTRAADRIQVGSALEAGKLIQAGYAVDYAGGRAAWPRQRDANGVGTRYSSGAHMMCLTGVRWKGSEPEYFWVANTGHGDHVSGPVGPIPVPAVYAACGGWVPARTVAGYLGHAHTAVTGWPVMELPDWGSGSYL